MCFSGGSIPLTEQPERLPNERRAERTNEQNERMMRTNERMNERAERLVCDFCNCFGRYPSVDEVRSSWQTSDVVTDEQIERVIRQTERHDMGLWN